MSDVESEELDEIIAELTVQASDEGIWESDDAVREMRKKAKASLLRWRTKSLLALLPEERPITYSVPLGWSVTELDKWNAKQDGYNKALEDIKNKVEGELTAEEEKK